ncbi:MAG: hypothetical protein IJF35_02560 [Clostridia bacterium]|nr:hypothetical protein [Clostridia bacterium]
MAIDAKTQKGMDTIKDFCAVLEEKKLKFTQKGDFIVEFNAVSKDIPIRIGMGVQLDKEVLYMCSGIPIRIPEEKRVEMAVAVSSVNQTLSIGRFNYDIFRGQLFFEINNSYAGSTLGKELYKYLIDTSVETIDEYNDLFLKLARGLITLEEFLKRQMV